MARLALRSAHIAETPVRSSSSDHSARAWHRSQHGNLLNRERGLVAPVALQRLRAVDDALGIGLEARGRSNRILVSPFHVLARSATIVRCDRRLHDAQF